MPPCTLSGRDVGVRLHSRTDHFGVGGLCRGNTIGATTLVIFRELLARLGLRPSVTVTMLSCRSTSNRICRSNNSRDIMCSRRHDKTMRKVLPGRPFVDVSRLRSIQKIDTRILTTLHPCLDTIPCCIPVGIGATDPRLLTSLVSNIADRRVHKLARVEHGRMLPSVSRL